MEEVAGKLDSIVGLRAYAFPPDKITPPAAFVSLPEAITYDGGYGRGSDTIDLGVLVLVSRSVDRVAAEKIAAYADGSGASSVKAALDSSGANPYTTCDTVRVASAEFGAWQVASVTYQGVEFTINITGSGS